MTTISSVPSRSGLPGIDQRQAGLRTRYGALRDIPEVVAMHDRCSDVSLHQRFHVATPRVGPRIVRLLLMPTDGWSVVAEQGGRVVALACAGPLSSVDLEVGLLVEDAHQRRGVGARMMRELAEDASARGYQRVHCLTRPDNDRVAATVRNAGLIARLTWNAGLMDVEMPVRGLAVDLPQPA